MPRSIQPTSLLLALITVTLAAPATAAVEFATLVTDLSAATAYVDPPDGLPHRLIAEQAGRILVWDGSSLTADAEPFLDLTVAGEDRVLAGGERGLLAMAVHPDYRSNGFIYIFYTSKARVSPAIAAGSVVIERYTREIGDSELADPDSAQIVLAIPHPDDNHNGGDLKFGRDGYLYVTVGDGGGSCDSTGHSGQDDEQLLGKMLRLDVDGADAFPADPLRNYAIPPANPLVGVDGLDEIWALGLRNPFRFTFDRATGDLYIGDVGQNSWEEIDRIAPGDVTAGAPVNFGWPCREGFDASGCADLPAACSAPAITATFVDPVRTEANTSEGGTWKSIIAGSFYRGSAVLPDLASRLVYGDANNDEVWAATPGNISPPGWATTPLATGKTPYAFGEDQTGELYVLSIATGELQCLQRAGGTPCTAWASLGDVFLGGFESGTTSGWTVSP